MAWAQCGGGLIVNCPAAISLQQNDIVLGYQLGQTPHYRKVTVQGITSGGFPGAFSTLATTGGGTLNGPFNFSGNVSVSGSVSVGSTLGATGLTSLSGGLTETGAASFAGDVTITGSGTALSVTNNALVGGTLGVTGLSMLQNARFRVQNFTSGTVPTPFGLGDMIYETDCVTATGTGCPAFWNGSTYVQYPYPPPIGIAFGSTGLTGLLGGTVATRGVGASLVSATGQFISGNAVTTNSAGTFIDAGVPPSGGTGGGGTVANCSVADSLAFYSGASSTVSCIAQTNSSIISRTSGGLLQESTAIPSGISAPNLNLTGTTAAAAVTMTGPLTLAASVVGGSNDICTQGTAPTSPVNGAEWCTTTGHFGHYTTPGTVGPFIGLAQLSASGGVSYNPSTGAFTCPQCVSAWGTGLNFTTGTVTINNFPWLALWEGDTSVTVHNDTYYLPPRWRYTSGTISDIYFWTGAGSFSVTLTANGSNVTGCTNISVTTANTPASPGTATCSAANTLAHNQALALVISSAAGSPISAGVGIDGSFTP